MGIDQREQRLGGLCWIPQLFTAFGLPHGTDRFHDGVVIGDDGRVVRPGLKVMFITGYAANSVVGNGHLEPAMAVVTKPFVMEALATRGGELIAGP